MSGFIGVGIGPYPIGRTGAPPDPVPVAGAELVVNGSMETGDPPSGWTATGTATLAREANERTGGAGQYSCQVTPANANEGARQIIAVANHTWHILSAWVYRKAGTGNAIFSLENIANLLSVADAVWGQYWIIRRSAEASWRPKISVNNVDTVALGDDVSIIPLVTSSLLSTRTYGSADCDLSAAITRTAGTQAGLVARLDSSSSPANFIIAYLDGAGSVKVDKCVSGTYTNVISGAVTYGSTKILRLVCSGNNVSAYYDGAQVGTTQTVSDAGIVGNVRHGLFSTYASNSFAGYVAA